MYIIDYNYRKPYSVEFLKISKESIDTIGVHHTGNYNTLKINTDYHIDTKKWLWCGYGFYIAKGIIYRVRGMEYQDAGIKGHNHHTVNIAIEGNFDLDQLSNDDRIALEWLVVYLKKDNDNIKYVKGHNEFNSTTCPGKNIDTDYFQKFLEIKKDNVEASKLKQELINETIRNDSLDNNIKELKKELEVYKANTVLLEVENKKLHKILKKSRGYSMQVYNMYRENLRDQRK